MHLVFVSLLTLSYFLLFLRSGQLYLVVFYLSYIVCRGSDKYRASLSEILPLEKEAKQPLLNASYVIS